MKTIEMNNQALVSYLITTGIFMFILDELSKSLHPVLLIFQFIAFGTFLILLRIIGNPNKISLNDNLISTGPFREIKWDELDWENSNIW